MLVMPFNNPMHGTSVPSFGGSWAEFLGIQVVRDFPSVDARLPLFEDYKERRELLRMPGRAPAFVLEPVR